MGHPQRESTSKIKSLAHPPLETFRNDQGLDESVHLGASLERQRHALEVELDDAQRLHENCKAEYARARASFNHLC